MNYVREMKPFKVPIQLKIELQELQKANKRQKIKIYEFQDFLDLESCAEKCKIKFKKFDKKLKVKLSFKDKEVKKELNKKGEFIFKRSLVRGVKEIGVEILSDNFFIQKSKKIKILRKNEVKKVRVEINKKKHPSMLSESELNNCHSLYFKATQNDFIHIGVDYSLKDLKIFVSLESLQEDSKSVEILAVYNPKQDLYVASLDLGDYYQILPNQGQYQIVIRTEDNQVSYCGSGFVQFNNKEIEKRKKSDTYESLTIEEHENKPLPSPVSLEIIILSALVLIVL